MKRFLFLYILLFFSLSLFSQNEFKYSIYSYGGLKIGSESRIETLTQIDSVNVVGDSLTFYVGAIPYYATITGGGDVGASYTFDYGLLEAGGTVDFDTTTLDSRYLLSSDTTELITGYGLDTSYNAAKTQLTLEVDTTKLATPYDLTQVTGLGTGGYDILSFTVGTTTNAPSVGDSLLTHGSLLNGYLDVWRGTQYGAISKQRLRDTIGYEITDSTLMFHPEFADGDYVEVWIYDSTDITELTLRSASSTDYIDDFESLTLGDLNGQSFWVTNLGGFTVVDNGGDKSANPNDGAFSIASYNKTFSNDQYAQATLNMTTSNNWIGVAVRVSGSGATSNGYMLIGEVNSSTLRKTTNGSTTTIASGSGYVDGDVIKLEAVGTEIRCYRNGVLDTSISTDGIVTDADHASGDAGLAGYGTATSNNASTWTGGDL